MSSSLLEIIELPNGEIVLKRADGESEPLVNIRFSEETRSYMPYIRLEIAKAMIQAGIQAFSELSEQMAVEELERDDYEAFRIVH
ncbi:MAG: hypothetical protein V7711_09440 [Pseudomonadales bacterium]